MELLIQINTLTLNRSVIYEQGEDFCNQFFVEKELLRLLHPEYWDGMVILFGFSHFSFLWLLLFG